MSRDLTQHLKAAWSSVVGFREKVRRFLGTDRESNVRRGEESGLTREQAEVAADMAEAFNDQAAVAGGITKVGQGAKKGIELVSAIGEDKTLVKLAEDAGASVQKGIDSLTKELGKGNLNPGLGTKKLFGDISYARARDGARVFFRRAGDKIEILAKASKKTEQSVIDKLKKLYQ